MAQALSGIEQPVAVPEQGVTRLQLTAFRNHDHLTLVMDRRPVVLAAPNGAGKTNILEALSLLAPGRGLRRARLAEIGALGSSLPWAVAARLETAGETIDIGTGLDALGGERRLVRIDGVASSAPALADRVQIAWMTPAMDRLFTDAASERRRFLDRMVLTLHPGHGRMVNDYEAAMRERNLLLADQGDQGWISAVEVRMAQAGVAIAAARRDTLAALKALIERRPEDAFPKAALALEGEVEADLDTRSALVAEDRLRARLRDQRGRDQAAGRALVGPHRSDLAAGHASKAMPAALCSTGEQKALLTGLVLAHSELVEAQRGIPPILLLDEVAAHLDAERRSALFDIIAARRAQSWLSGTDASLFAALVGRAQFFGEREGGIKALN